METNKTDKECWEILGIIFSDTEKLYNKLSPNTFVNSKQEFFYLLGLCVYDIFSNNNEVTAIDSLIYDFGSFRGSGGLVADFLNRCAVENSRTYNYMDFYMGTIWIKTEVNLIPLYEFIFQKLKDMECDWKFLLQEEHYVSINQIIQAYKNIYKVLPTSYTWK